MHLWSKSGFLSAIIPPGGYSLRRISVGRVRAADWPGTAATATPRCDVWASVNKMSTSQGRPGSGSRPAMILRRQKLPSGPTTGRVHLALRSSRSG
jgi:hypothetical protein